MRARKAFIFTADAIIAFYLITIMLSILLLINYTPRTYLQQFQTIARDTLIVLGNLKLKDVGANPLYPYSNHLLYVKNNSETVWSMFRRTLQHNVSIPSAYPNSSSIWWTAALGPADTPVYSSPAIYNGRLVISSRNGTYLFDENSGRIIWYKPIPADSSPTIINGKIFIGSVNNDFFSLDETGNIAWNFSFSNKILSSPVVHNGKVFVGSTDNSLYAFDESSGNLTWRFDTQGNISSSPVVYNGRVIFFSNDSYLYGVDEDSGKELWRYGIPTPSEYFLDPSPVIAGGVVYFANGNKFYAVNATDGKEIGNATLSGYIFTSSPVFDNATAIYVGYTMGICRVNFMGGGALLNCTPLSSTVYSSPVILNDTILVATSKGELMLLYKNNMSSIWEYDINSSFYSSPAVVNGRIYIGANDGNLYSFGNCSIWDENMPVLDYIATFWLMNKKDCAKALAKEFLDAAIPGNYGFEMTVKPFDTGGHDCNGNSSSWDSIYTNDCNQTLYRRVLIRDSRYISGVFQSGSVVHYFQRPIEVELRLWN